MGHMKTPIGMVRLVVALTLVLGSVILRATEQPPKYTVEEIMKAVFKGDDSVAKRVGQGKGTPADLDKLAEYVSSLPINDAPQGDAAGWKKKTTAVVDAVTALKAGQAGALTQFNQAVDCKSCHSVYRPVD
jgi:cytochrome c556